MPATTRIKLSEAAGGFDLELSEGYILIRLHTNEGEHQVGNFGLLVAEPEGLPKFRAEVMAVGPGVTDVGIGDLVIFRRWAPEPLHHTGSGQSKAGYYLIHDDNLDARITEET